MKEQAIPAEVEAVIAEAARLLPFGGCREQGCYPDEPNMTCDECWERHLREVYRDAREKGATDE